MRIGVDFSGVIINSDVAKVATAQRFLGISLDPTNTLKTTHGELLDLDTRATLMSLLFCTSELLGAPAIPGAPTYIAKLRALGAHVTIVSNINPGGVSFAEQWLRAQNIRNVEFVSVGIGSSKSILLQHGFDVFIDDKLANLRTLGVHVSHKILLDHVYNHHLELPADVRRMQYWRDIYAYLQPQLLRAPLIV